MKETKKIKVKKYTIKEKNNYDNISFEENS